MKVMQHIHHKKSSWMLRQMLGKAQSSSAENGITNTVNEQRKLQRSLALSAGSASLAAPVNRSQR